MMANGDSDGRVAARLAGLQTFAAIATIAIATVGCETGATNFDFPDAGKTPAAPDLTGRWAMFAWEDPVAVDLRTTGTAISGDGCCGGFSSLGAGISCCGDVTGQVVDRRAAFGFTFDFGGDRYEYATDVFVSADGRRMAGRFSRTGGPIAWVPIASDQSWLPVGDANLQPLEEVLSAHMAGYGLVLTDDPPPAADFMPAQTYSLATDSRFVYGELGAFWAGEMSWDADAQTLVVGPVPETAPGLPVALWLRFDGNALMTVEAAMASGAHYHFAAMASQP